MNSQLVFLSIDPEWATAILENEKQYEYRRQPPTIEPPYYVLLYATGRVGSVVGSFKVTNVITGTVNEVIEKTVHETPHTDTDIKQYFEGKQKGSALEISNVTRYSTEIPIETIKKVNPEFTVPQNFQYICSIENEELVSLLPSEQPLPKEASSRQSRVTHW